MKNFEVLAFREPITKDYLLFWYQIFATAICILFHNLKTKIRIIKLDSWKKECNLRTRTRNERYPRIDSQNLLPRTSTNLATTKLSRNCQWVWKCVHHVLLLKCFLQSGCHSYADLRIKIWAVSPAIMEKFKS